jgi:formate-dependent nitrite reductase membrane component NrfD
MMTANASDSVSRTLQPQRARSAGDDARASYYGRPVIHKAHWKWEIIVYFFVGGISGASYVLAALANWFGGRHGREITRAGRYLAFLGVIPSAVLLIADLKRPARFHHMLRVLKVRSPMSVGVWVLSIFGGFATVLALIQATHDGWISRTSLPGRMTLMLPTRLTEAAGLLPALMLSGYTGVLLAATATPLWTKRHLQMGPLFVASAFSNASAAIVLWLGLRRRTDTQDLGRLEKIDSIALMTELALLVSIKRQIGSVTARPLERGHTGLLHRYGVIVGGIGLPLLLQAKTAVFGKPPTRTIALLSSVLVLIGGMIFRYVMVIGGHQSADDPEATFEMTRRQAHPRPN